RGGRPGSARRTDSLAPVVCAPLPRQAEVTVLRSRGAVRLIGAAALLTLALALGFVAGIPVLVICLAATQNRTFAIAMGLMVLAGVVGFVALRVAPMLLTRKESQRFAAAGVAGAAILL